MRAIIRYGWMRIRRTTGRLIRARLSSHSIALGVSIGLFLGCSPLLGLHMAGAVFLATLLRASRLAALAFVWISNPLTFLPLYGFTYWLGHKITGREPGWREYEAVLRRAEAVIRARGFFSGVEDGFRELGSLGPEALENLLVGCLVAGVLLGGLAYLPSRWLVEWLRRKRQLRVSGRGRGGQ